MQPVTPDDYRAIELSCWQGMVDFAQLREDGVEAVVLHATAGTQWVDPYLRQDAKHAGEQGLLLGFIHTLLARDEQTAQQEAAWFFRALSGLVPDFRLCVAPDNENGLSREAFCAVCAAFLQALEALCGHVPMLRVPQSTVKLLTGDLLPYPLWVCAYGVDAVSYTHLDVYKRQVQLPIHSAMPSTAAYDRQNPAVNSCSGATHRMANADAKIEVSRSYGNPSICATHAIVAIRHARTAEAGIPTIRQYVHSNSSTCLLYTSGRLRQGRHTFHILWIIYIISTTYCSIRVGRRCV